MARLKIVCLQFATILPREFEFMKKDITKKILKLSELEKKLSHLRYKNTIGLCHGVFDLIHAGHIDYFEECTKLVDILIVSVTTDEYVNKGLNRPLMGIKDRLKNLSAVEYLDFVIESDFASAVPIINIVKPDYYFKGKDYVKSLTDKSIDTAGNLSNEIKAVEKYGGEIHFTKSLVKSSSKLINSLKNKSELDKETELYLKKKLNHKNLAKMLEKLEGMKITIIGELIVDEYIFTESLGKSGKHPLVAERELSNKKFWGGIMPSILTINSFIGSKNLSVVSLGDESFLKDFRGNTFGVTIDSKYKVTRKVRFINQKTNTFLFEKYEMNDDYITSGLENKLTKKVLRNIKNSNMFLSLDFGHGLITPKIRNILTRKSNYLAINVQKNAGNKGFSLISKYDSAQVVVLNGDEVELELKQKKVNKEEAAKIIHKNMKAKILAITDGADGLIITNGRKVVRVPALQLNNITDRTGAGDSLFTLISLFSLVTKDLIVLGYLGNIGAALSLNWFANEKFVSKEDLIRAVTYDLK